MAIVKKGYVHQQTSTNHHPNGRTYRDWWLVKYDCNNRLYGSINLTKIILPPQYVGKKIRIKIEVKENENKKRL